MHEAIRLSPKSHLTAKYQSKRLDQRQLTPRRRASKSQTEAEDIRAGGNRNILLAAYCKGHRRGLHTYVGREFPQRFAVAFIHSCEASVWTAILPHFTER